MTNAGPPMIIAQPQNPAPLVIKHGNEEVLRIERDREQAKTPRT